MNKKLHFIQQIARHMEAFKNVEQLDKAALEQIFLLFSLFFERATDKEAIGFTTLFSRIAYFGIQHQLPKSLVYETQFFRKTLESGTYSKDLIPDLSALGLHLIQANINKVYKYPYECTFEKPEKNLDADRESKLSYKRIQRAILFEISDNSVEVILDDSPDTKMRVRIDEAFVSQLKQIKKHLSLPVIINLVDVNWYTDEDPLAKAFVLRPDFLLGVTSVSECFSSTGATSLKYFGRKLIPSDSSVHMLIGNVVNHYLDELIHNPSLEFKEMLSDTFQIAPVRFSVMSDDEVKDCISKVRVHFENLKNVVTTELSDAGITKERSYLEPSFYSNEFGLLGRLDLYHHNEQTAKSDIVELKSGKLYQAHKYGLNQNHYVQTLLYDLILESVYDAKVKSTNYILYSANDSKRLRFAPKVRNKQLDALRLRNTIILIEEILTKLDKRDTVDILSRLDPESIPEAYTFLRRDAKKFWDAYGRLTELEQSYYKVFVAFITREFQLSKIGRHGIYTSNGLASLWLDPMVEKADMFTILSLLEVLENYSDQEVPTLTLGFSAESNRLSKFRVGDIVILYPYDDPAKSVLSNQLFKCTILELDADQVKLRLRARQKNFDIFRKFRFWNLESDTLDSGFTKQYHGLFDFMVADSAYKRRILNLDPPAKPSESIPFNNSTLTEEQQGLMRKAISAEDYFLLWGPPGTGKTSKMISELVAYYYKKTQSEILILAYTNRAVDEICSAVHDVLEGNYLRIGSRYSTAEKYRTNLLSSRIESLTSRASLREVFQESRVTISTLSSFQGKKEIQLLKKYDLVIIDEASQLLEPMLVGLLSHFKKFILIGDHKQLPAVVTQAAEQSVIQDDNLRKKCGLLDARTSLFERLYKQAESKGWDWAYGGLTNQGRMHQDLVQFVSREFYDSKLSILLGIERLSQPSSLLPKTENQKKLIENRVIFVDTPKGQNITRKTNLFEAKIVASLINEWVDIYKYNGLELNPDSIGVITPFRSQIAMIKNQENLSRDLPVTIDTIERYQGGARDRIFISMAVSEAELLDSISNVNSEGIDRKLNVALTRARSHLVIVGNKQILSRKDLYSRLISSAYELDLS